jgi:hypothetical protein
VDHLYLTGFNGTDGDSCRALFDSFAVSKWNGTSLLNTARMAINDEPYAYRSSAGSSQPGSLFVARRPGQTSGPGTVIISGAPSVEYALQVRDVSSGSSPNRTISGISWGGIRHDGGHVISDGTDRCLLSAGGGNSFPFVVTNISSAAQTLGVGNVAGWSDSLTSANNFFLQLGTLASTHRAAIIESSGHALFTRLGITATSTVIGPVQAASLPAPVSSAILTVVDSAGYAGTTIGSNGFVTLSNKDTPNTGDYILTMNNTSANLPLARKIV